MLFAPDSKKPVAHGVHALWSALATEPPPQAVHSAAPPELYQPSGQLAHCSTASAPSPTVSPYSPASHSTQAVLSEFAALPEAHSVQLSLPEAAT